MISIKVFFVTSISSRYSYDFRVYLWNYLMLTYALTQRTSESSCEKSPEAFNFLLTSSGPHSFLNTREYNCVRMSKHLDVNDVSSLTIPRIEMVVLFVYRQQNSLLFTCRAWSKQVWRVELPGETSIGAKVLPVCWSSTLDRRRTFFESR